MTHYSIFSLARNALLGHRGWSKAWRSPEPQTKYDAIIIGGGGHGLATAYYLAKEHHMTKVAVLEKGWLGGGNTGRNTTIIRSNYLRSESAALYDHALKLWEGLSRDLNFNVMFSQRGVVTLAHSPHEVRTLRRRHFANRADGIDSDWLETDALRDILPQLSCGPTSRYPVLGAALQRRGGTARHDAVAWGYARAADARGVDIIQNCEVTGFIIRNGQIEGVETTKGPILSSRVGMVASGHSSVLANLAGFRLPLQSHPLQALVSEPLKPILNLVVMSGAVHGYISQSDKGELVIGAGIDSNPSYSQRGTVTIVADAVRAVVELFPCFSRVKMLRQWGGIVDIAPDASPIIGKTPVAGLYINCGWGTGGFKATPGSGHVFAHLIATDNASPLIQPFSLNRFVSGRLIDEHGAAAVAH